VIPHRSARGFSLIECLAAIVIIGFALLVGFSCVLWADRVERRAGERAQAAELAASVAERLRAGSYADVHEAQWDESQPGSLAGAHVELVVEEDANLQLKQVGVVVTWTGERPGMLRLDTAVGRAEVYR
jgi:prepilin-type N-terminal cleavage/methylation domain-containing protein